MKNENCKVIDKDTALANWYDEYIYLREKETGDIYRLKIEYDEYAESPREWYNLCTIFSQRGDWNIADDGFAYSRDEAADKYEEYKERQEKGEIFMCPVYMYDHSGQTISLTSFGDPWDSGVAGYIFVEKEKILKETNATEENWKEKAYKYMQSEIKIYDNYITGEVYGYNLEKAEVTEHKRISDGTMWTTVEWESEDGCCGFYGDPETSGLIDNAIGNRFDYIEDPDIAERPF